MDILYPMCNGSFWDHNELRYSLRSVEQHLKGHGKVWIIGYKPDWCINVEHIPSEDPYEFNKAANIINKIMIGCLQPKMSHQFLRMSDDNYFLKDIDILDINPRYNEDLNTKKNWTASDFHHLLKRTQIALNKRGFPAYSYETHVPMPIDKLWFPAVMLKYDYGYGEGYVTNSIYFNETVPDPQKLDYDTRIGVFQMKQDIDFGDKTFLCHSDLGLSYQLMDAIEKRFPVKSKFEI